MKTTLKFFAMALLSGAMVTACGGDEEGNEKPGGGGIKPGDYPPNVLVTSAPTGAVQAGMNDAVEIIGEGFEGEQDFIQIGFEKEGELVFERVDPAVLTLKPKRIAFGIHVDAAFRDKSFKVYLDRPGYDKMPLTGELKVTLPTVAEGYIPDPAFRKTLIERNPAIKAMFNLLGLIDVPAAASMIHGGGDYALDLAECMALSYEGIELFKSVKGTVAAWNAPNVKVIDLSKWQALGLDFHTQGAGSLEKFVGAPYMLAALLGDCPKLTSVDISKSDWCRRCEILPKTTEFSAVTYLDMRRKMTGTWKDVPSAVGEYTIFAGDSFFKLAENATILIDAWTIFDHNVENNGKPSCWANIYEAWKRGATLKVYSWVDIEHYIATAPTYAEDPDALSPNNKKGTNQPSNKWQVDDPLSEDINEAPEPYVPPVK